MIGLITLGGIAVASTAALVYDWFSDQNENKQPAVVINTERVTTESNQNINKMIVAGMIIAGAYVYFKYIKRR